MSSELLVLLSTAAGIGLVHTLVGPDHYVPFIAMSKARGWSVGRTAVITLLCGIGHVGSSIVLGMIGIAAGITLDKLELTESIRGDVAAWLLTSFGVVYLAWGVRRAIRNKTHTHRHSHAPGGEHEHEHSHVGEHTHPHIEPGTKKNITPLVLFTIFLFGPCEPLIPLLMYPAAAQSAWGVAMVATVFGVVTVATMLAVVTAASLGLGLVGLGRLERYGHALAGGLITLCGAAIHLGL